MLILAPVMVIAFLYLSWVLYEKYSLEVAFEKYCESRGIKEEDLEQ